MSTTTLNAYSAAFPSITNRMKATVSRASSPMAPVVSDIKLAPHPIRMWNFPGLPRDNYVFSLDEIDGAGVVVANKAYFSVVPSVIDGLLVRDDEQITVGLTTGLIAGATGFTFDGTGGKPDYRSWVIVPSELDGRGILKIGEDYTWDPILGIFLLLQAGDLLQDDQVYNIHFNTVVDAAGGSVPVASFDFLYRLITTDEALSDTDFGKKVIVEPSGSFLVLGLPALSVIPDGRPLTIEVTGSGLKNVKLSPYAGDTINWQGGQVYIMSGESLTIWKMTRSLGVYEWRISSPCGNFFRVGETVFEDQVEVELFNKAMLDGSSVLVSDYKRFYETYVANLDLTSVVDYDTWATLPAYKKYFSKANSANPANAGKFMLADRRGLYPRATNTGLYAGNYLANQIKAHGHRIMVDNSNGSGGNTYSLLRPGSAIAGALRAKGYILNDSGSSKIIEETGGTETNPETVYLNQYVVL